MNPTAIASHPQPGLILRRCQAGGEFAFRHLRPRELRARVNPGARD